MISIIVAASTNGVIGRKNGLPWNLPDELAYFRAKTTNHPIIMGRATHESIGRALPNRTNIVITSDKNATYDNCEVAGSLGDAIALAKKSPGNDEIFIIGGESVYKQALPFADRIYLTEVKANVKGDKYFIFDKSGWKKISEDPRPADDNNKFAYSFTVLEKRP